MNHEPKTMKELAEIYSHQLMPLKEGEIIEVEVLDESKTKILVDVAGFCLGVIYEKEFSPDMSEMKKGGKILAQILTLENSDGYCVLSLRRADKEKMSKILEEKFAVGGVLTVHCTNANRGGLLCIFGEYEGFLPVSQLSTNHYPKVASADKDEILSKLRKLVNQNLQVKILAFEPNANKLIFSEKAASDATLHEKIKDYKIGDVLEGEVTGVVDFGLFVNLGEVEGLVHISEVSWDHVDDLKQLYQVGKKVKVEIISTENNRLSLSIKRLIKDPWIKLVEKYKKGDAVKGEVTKITPFGALVKVTDGISGWVHISKIGSEKVAEPNEKIEVGKVYNFEVLSVEAKLHKLNLALKEEKIKKKSKKPARPLQGDAGGEA